MGCMDSPGVLLTILVLLASIFATAGYGLMSVAQRRAARVAFGLTAICFGIIGAELGLFMAWPLPLKILAAGCFGFVAAAGLVYAWHSIGLLEKVPTKPTFPYVEAMVFPGSPLEPRQGILLVKGAPSLTNVEVQVFPNGGGQAQRFFYPVVYERGEPLYWFENGARKIIEFEEGEYMIQLTDLNGTYLEFMRLRSEGGKLKRSVDVEKRDGTVPSGLVRLFYENDP